MNTDLNKLREVLIQNQQRGVVLPERPDRQIVTDRHGNIILGSDARAGQMTTQVPQEVFAHDSHVGTH